MQTFNNWYADKKALFDLEHKIQREKLDEGINGVEWLVMQKVVGEREKSSLDSWIECLKQFKQPNAESVMRDAIKMKPNKFYKKYEFNWWISIDETITYLSLMKSNDYDKYFDFILSIK